MVRLLLLSLLSCAAPLKNVDEDAREQAALGARAEKYWRAARWADATEASAFVADSGERIAFEALMEERWKDHRLTEATVLRVALEPPTVGAPREATVTVKTQGYDLPEQVLRTEMVTQRWFRAATDWYLVWPEPPETP